ncbi:MAG TPA: MBL fold metallo-hydrolase, partial [Steroidobacteraceae bacterium]|nr:MBL fold metallo-hydrolase [Steroidobacteraceae bacterium]
MELTLRHLGGVGTVTGSKHLLEARGTRLLVDCGLFQGLKALREANWRPLPVDADTIDAIVLTHAHLDHSGYLPRLLKDGFRGPIYMSAATAAVAELILLDSAHIQERDAEAANRHGYSKHKPALPLYTVRDAERVIELFKTIDFHRSFALPGGAQVLLRRAGHILGAATAEISWHGRKIVFSGDLGRYNDAVMRDPESVPEADYVVVESTYGDRNHNGEDPAQVLGDIIEKTTARGGSVIIPTFAVGRAQTILYHLWRLKQAGRLGVTPVYLDSPMAIDATGLMHSHHADHRLSEQQCDGACHVATYLRDVEESKALTANPLPKVILAGSGMATSGRVLHHLVKYGPDRRNTIVLSGFQAAGTRGRSLAEGAKELKIHGQWVPIAAEVRNLDMLSAHADAGEILRWLAGFRHAPRKVFIVHGEPHAADALRV